LTTPFQPLELIKAEHPKLSLAVDALSQYILQLRQQGQDEVEPSLASQSLHVSEALVLGVLKLFEEQELVQHVYNIFCGKQRTFIGSVPNLKEIPSALYCRHCDTQHSKDDFEVELVFKVLDSAWQPLSHNVAAR
jgi:hypothetical protein